MDYPGNLPKPLKARAEAACARAELEFTQAQNRLPLVFIHGQGSVKSPIEIRRLLIKRIKAEVSAFAHQACVAANDGQMEASDIQGYVDQFLRTRSINLCPDTHTWSGYSEGFQQEVRESLFGSSEWEVHLSERIEAAEAQTSPDHAPTTLPDMEGANVFRRTPDGWDIRYGGQTWSGKSPLQGLSLIQTLLGNPWEIVLLGSTDRA